MKLRSVLLPPFVISTMLWLLDSGVSTYTTFGLHTDEVKASYISHIPLSLAYLLFGFPMRQLLLKAPSLSTFRQREDIKAKGTPVVHPLSAHFIPLISSGTRGHELLFGAPLVPEAAVHAEKVLF
jgi:hypothetical protein